MILELRPTMRSKALAVLAIAALTAFSAAALAGGMPDEEDDQQIPSKSIVGFVRDAKGNVIADAKVIASFKTGNTDLITRSDATGHFRIPGFSKDANADSVNVACSKPGYKQTGSLKRRSAASDANAPIEIDCQLGPE
jgi:carboxypeptidase family protein